jgi:hypothetical protein
LIHATQGGKQLSVVDIIEFVKKLNQQNTYKSLAKTLQKEMISIFPFQECVVLFLDQTTGQYFNIVFSEDDDSALWFKTMIEQKKEVIKKLQENMTRNK